VFSSHSEPKQDSGAEAQIVVGTVEEVAPQVVSLNSPSDTLNQLVIEASAESGGKSGFRAGQVRA
jgi:hypothetical protein